MLLIWTSFLINPSAKAKAWNIGTCNWAGGLAKYTCPTFISTSPTKVFVVIKIFYKQNTYHTCFWPLLQFYRLLYSNYSSYTLFCSSWFFQECVKNQHFTCWYLVGFVIKLKNKHFKIIMESKSLLIFLLAWSKNHEPRASGNGIFSPWICNEQLLFGGYFWVYSTCE